MGKFKKDILNQIQNDNVFDIIKDFNLISIENFLKIFENQGEEYKGLNKSINILNFLRDYRKITTLNSKLISRFTDLVQSLVLVLNYNFLLKKQKTLLRELELSKIKNKSSDLSAKTDLLNILNESINKNKKKLKFREEDFFYLKNQRDQIVNIINDYNLKIRDLNKKKKECFSQINRITREMSDTSQKSKNPDFNFIFEDKKDLTKSERIKTLQNQAKDSQHEIKQIELKINESQQKLNEITPNYESLKNDYQTLLNTIQNDKIHLKSIRRELEEKIKENEYESLRDFDFNDLSSIKETHEIEDEIQKIKSELGDRLKYDYLLDKKNPENLSEITNKFKELDNTLMSNKNSYIISYENSDITNCIEHFRKVETLINNLEEILNNFLIKINLKAHFQIIVNEDFNNFFIKVLFVRSNKESLIFDELTTPQKIFFVMTFYISIKIQLDSNHIIFSNLLVPNKFNKRGSIFRTIRSILPVFEEDDNLKKFNLIFIISNLELKKPIDNLKIIDINKK